MAKQGNERPIPTAWTCLRDHAGNFWGLYFLHLRLEEPGYKFSSGAIVLSHQTVPTFWKQ